MYFVRTPKIIQWLYPGIVWDMPAKENKIYLTFDDGPHPEITLWILDQLKKYNAKATFFCLGENVEKYPQIMKQILGEGHRIGSHGYAHLNGWRTKNEIYLEDVKRASQYINSNLFRPPYGKIKRSQLKMLSTDDGPRSTGDNVIQHSKFKIYNFSLMPGDFDQKISSEKCYSKLIKNIKSGDIVCLHDNEKAREHLEYCLPKWLEYLSGNFLFSVLP
ncbi:MAG: polysaccharide deacetylase [Bacteroidota bacterium]|nr:polysaccharide deacetylase [Bacteroidota bacterium]